MKKSKKAFDAVKMMREIRDKLSMQFEEMNFEEQKHYMRERLGVKAKPRRAGRVGMPDRLGQHPTIGTRQVGVDQDQLVLVAVRAGLL